jgi:LPPG:FO 2-phospho-L-lactate transferase
MAAGPIPDPIPDPPPDPTDRPVVVLAGGFGGAKLSHGVALAGAERRAAGSPGVRLTVVVNTGDDLELHGLHISPDLDTVMYTLAGLANPATGWGVIDETWSVAAMLERYGAPTWFRLGDRDIATHLLRTAALRSGRRLTDVTRDLCARLGVSAELLPMSDDQVRTEVRGDAGWLEFQDWFVRRGQRDEILEVRHRGAEVARPTPEVLAAIRGARLIILAPSNPFVSIGTILAVPGMLEALRASPARRVAISPIVAGHALRGPADRMLASLGGEASAAGFVAHYEGRHPGLVDDYVIDSADAAAIPGIVTAGARVVALGTVMQTDDDRRGLGAALLDRWLPISAGPAAGP